MTRNKLLTPHQIVEFAMRIDQAGSTLNESLLLEELDKEVALKISQGNDELISMLDELNKAFAGKVPAVDKEIEKLRSAADKSATILKKLVKGSDSKLSSEKLLAKIASFFKGKIDPKALMNSILLLQSRAQELVEILKYSTPKIIKKLEAAGAKETETRKMYEVLGANQSMVEMALKDLLKKAKPGLFKTAGNFFKSLNVDKKIINLDDAVDYDTIAKEMSEMVVADFFSVHNGTASIQTDGGKDFKNVMKDAAGSLKTGSKAEDTGTDKMSAPPESEDEAKEEQSKSEDAIKTAIQDVSKEKIPPKAAALKAMDDWSASLSASAQKDLNAKNRMGDLKDAIGMALDDASKAVEGEVEAAVQAWRDEHEEQLIKNKRFTKKSFDSLQDMIPKLTSFLMKTQEESTRRLTVQEVRKFVFAYLDKKVLNSTDNMLQEKTRMPKEVAELKKNRRNPGDALRNMVRIAKIIKEMRESDVRDSRGNVVIEPGLKVRHKK